MVTRGTTLGPLPSGASEIDKIARKLNTTSYGVVILFCVLGAFALFAIWAPIYLYWGKCKCKRTKPSTPENVDVEKFDGGVRGSGAGLALSGDTGDIALNSVSINHDVYTQRRHASTASVSGDSEATTATAFSGSPPGTSDSEDISNTAATTNAFPSTPPGLLPSTSASSSRSQITQSTSLKNRFRKLLIHTLPTSIPQAAASAIPLGKKRPRADTLTSVPWLMVSPRLSTFTDLDADVGENANSEMGYNPSTSLPVLSGAGDSRESTSNSTSRLRKNRNRRSAALRMAITPSPSLALANQNDNTSTSFPSANTFSPSLPHNILQGIQHMRMRSPSPSPSPNLPYNTTPSLLTYPASTPDLPQSQPHIYIYPSSHPNTPIPSIILSNSESGINVIFDPAQNPQDQDEGAEKSISGLPTGKAFPASMSMSIGLGFGFSLISRKSLSSDEGDGHNDAAAKASNNEPDYEHAVVDVD